MSTVPVIIYGVGGFGREVAWLVEQCLQAGDDMTPVCFVDDNSEHFGKVINGLPAMSLHDAAISYPGAVVAGGIGAPRIRQKVMDKAKAAGFRFQTIVHPRVERSKWIEIGEGTLICAGNILTTNIILGAHVQLNLDCTIGHDVVMDEYATLAPGVHISGCVHLGKRAYVGTGAVIINGTPDNPIIIGDDAVIGAGACVTKSVPPGTTVVGVPAKPLSR
ncbi:MAG: acetyltransferase [Caldilineaceae bacterium]|nr:acetyltransferase [Caldilinea sp.]MCB0057816.1 acetyltransferase [Caldilineaceae bacterium]